ncbi:FkbM family methyltransferase [Ideonella sp. BN130291]|uniref:FkbM family methyltransferase n=1 Tax=Ideonella sp. BN130291 TaxID=3112940 RepID=UPI002E268AD0|nr:FkbM family methyltransferase [Ideonella sp. BN130291]
MPISYAQNFEDVMLLRALGHVPQGFYIDVGAQDPIADSVSMAFYELGWRGIHVEPTPAYARALRDARPDETVIQAAVSEQTGLLTLYDVHHTGLSTSDAALAENHRSAGYGSTPIAVPCVTLASIFEVCGNRDVHWLKIDVEGMEASVIRSWEPSEQRPWILVVEATRPRSKELSYEDWDPLVVQLGYQFVYFDGLNRFYVSERHPELVESLQVPPNVFDGFSLSGLSAHSFCDTVKAAEAHARALAAQAEEQAAQEQQKSRACEERVRSIEKAAEAAAEAAAEVPALRESLSESREELARVRQQQVAELAYHQEQLAALREQSQADLLEMSARRELADAQRAEIEARMGRTEALLAAAREQVMHLEEAQRLLEQRLSLESSQHADLLAKAHAQLRRETERREALEHESAETSAKAAEATRQAQLLEHRLSLQQQHALVQEAEAVNALHAVSDAADRRVAQLQEQHAATLQRQRRQMDDLVAGLQTQLVSAERSLRQARDEAVRHEAVVLARLEASRQRLPLTSKRADGHIRTPDERADMLPAAHSADTPASSLEALLALHDERFVRAAYATVLGRQADASGLSNFLTQVRAGVSKEIVVAQLAMSSEGRSRGVSLPGLAELLRRVPTRPLSLWSRAVRKMMRGSLLPVEDKLRSLENRLAVQQEEYAQAAESVAQTLSSRIDDIGHALAAAAERSNHRSTLLEDRIGELAQHLEDQHLRSLEALRAVEDELGRIVHQLALFGADMDRLSAGHAPASGSSQDPSPARTGHAAAAQTLALVRRRITGEASQP